jgi:hypothetical protein
MKFQVTVYYERSTKGSHLYKNQAEKIYGWYISKYHMPDPPQALTITVEEAKEEK